MPSVILCFHSSVYLQNSTLIELVKLITTIIKTNSEMIKRIIESDIFLKLNPYIKLENKCSFELLRSILILISEILYIAEEDKCQVS